VITKVISTPGKPFSEKHPQWEKPFMPKNFLGGISSDYQSDFYSRKAF
jgi:hypothetical protein